MLTSIFIFYINLTYLKKIVLQYFKDNSKKRKEYIKVAFRVDSSFDIGSGHVMRCLTLAEELYKQGVNINFICRQHSGKIYEYNSKKG